MFVISCKHSAMSLSPRGRTNRVQSTLLWTLIWKCKGHLHSVEDTGSGSNVERERSRSPLELFGQWKPRTLREFRWPRHFLHEYFCEDDPGKVSSLPQTSVHTLPPLSWSASQITSTMTPPDFDGKIISNQITNISNQITNIAYNTSRY